MNKILNLVCLCSLITQISGVFWNDLRVRFGPGGAPTDRYFLKYPRLTSDAVTQGWNLVNSSDCENGGRFFGMRYRLGNDDSIYLLFDINGVIAGIQCLFLYEDIIMTKPDFHFNYSNVPMFQNETVDGKFYAVLTTYFVLPASICSTGRNELDLLTEGTGSGIFVQNGSSPDSLVVFPPQRSIASSQGWTNCECFNGMGLHNFWKVEEWNDLNCTEILPVQILYTPDKEELLGFVFQVFGPTSSTRFERPFKQGIYAIIGPSRVPSCIDTATYVAPASFHVYFVDKPWDIKCNNN